MSVWVLFGALTLFVALISSAFAQTNDLPSVLEDAQKSVESENTNISSTIDYAQQNVTMPPVNFSKLFSENKYFQVCFDIPPPVRCFPAVDVLYQDGSTVALKSDYIDLIWRAVAEVKKSAYKIDDITSYPISNTISGGTDVNILVVMSR